MIKKNIALISTILTSTLLSPSIHAWGQDTHSGIVKVAIAYMRTDSESANAYNFFKNHSGAPGEEVDDNQYWPNILAEASKGLDHRKDTKFCSQSALLSPSATLSQSGDCPYAPAANLAAALTNYTSFWHFYNINKAGKDEPGFNNEHAGYSYKLSPIENSTLGEKSLEDEATNLWLGGSNDTGVLDLSGDSMDDGKSIKRTATYYRKNFKSEIGLKKGAVASFNTQDEAKPADEQYKRHFQNFSDIEFQSIDNVGDFWYYTSEQIAESYFTGSIIDSPVLDTGALSSKNYNELKNTNIRIVVNDYLKALGHSLHTVQDVTSPYHLIGTLGQGHQFYEEWVRYFILDGDGEIVGSESFWGISYPVDKDYIPNRNTIKSVFDKIAGKSSNYTLKEISENNTIKEIIHTAAVMTDDYMLKNYKKPSGKYDLDKLDRKKAAAQYLLDIAVATTVLVLNKAFNHLQTF